MQQDVEIGDSQREDKKIEKGGWRLYMQLTKPSLTILVVFSSVMCYLLAPNVVEYQWEMILLLFVGGFLVTGSANAINQTVEKDTDAIMSRTAGRPIAKGALSVQQGWTFAIVAGVLGVGILGVYFNILSAALAAGSLFLYAFIYTPLKKVSSIAVLVGAIPGALPCLIGWTAGEDALSAGGWALFALQFFWQFPHFWAIAWLAHTDYTQAGFKLLPSDKGPTKFTAVQTIIYSLVLVPVTMLPFILEICTYSNAKGTVGVILIAISNMYMIWRCVELYRKMTKDAARQVMFGSYLYLAVVLLAFWLSKA